MKKQKKVLIGMSGGVDSSVAAYLLKKRGYDVIGAFLKVYSEKNPESFKCAWAEDRKEAMKIASILNIPLVTLDYEEYYKKYVLEPMFREYSSGKTPNPDILCNSLIKFPFLWKAAKKYKADFIATGHYARIKKTKKGFQLLAGRDSSKDQSYFLANLTQKELSHTLFPLGEYTKKQVRKIAKKLNFPNWDKPSTKGICFVGKQNMLNFLRKKISENPGKVKDPEGNILGTHLGAAFYTIGQKALESRGILIKKPKKWAQKRLYIAKKIGNEIIVVPKNHPLLKTKKILLRKFHLINKKEKIPHLLKARFRHLGKLYPGKLTKQKNRWIFTFDKPQEALAEGQYLVLYQKNKLIGAGEIRLK